MEFEQRRPYDGRGGREKEYDVQAPAPRRLTTRFQLGGCQRCGGVLVYELEEYACLQCGARV